MFTGSDHDIHSIISRARVRIGQAAQLLQQQDAFAFPAAAVLEADACLVAADSAWRELTRRHEDDPQRWRNAQVDGLRTEQVLERLNEVVYELVRVAAGDAWLG
jgi:hypothetical protein